MKILVTEEQINELLEAGTIQVEGIDIYLKLPEEETFIADGEKIVRSEMTRYHKEVES